MSATRLTLPLHGEKRWVAMVSLSDNQAPRSRTQAVGTVAAAYSRSMVPLKTVVWCTGRPVMKARKDATDANVPTEGRTGHHRSGKLVHSTSI
jgi:hypothetical protein